MKRSRISALVLATVLGLWLAALPLQAYTMLQVSQSGRVTSGARVACEHPGGFAHWNPARNSNIQWWMNHFNQGLGKIDAVRGAAAAWTNVPNADHRPVFAGYSPFGWATDGRNTIIFANGNGCTGSCLALTALVTQNDQEIIESDITFNNAVNWQTNGTDIDTQAVLTHEFGHSLGIHHSSVPRATMEPFYSGPGGRTLAVDDHSALQCSQNRYGYLRVRVHGPTSIGPNETGTWICAASGGGPPYTHSWLKTSVHGITRLGFGMRAETSDSVSFNIVCDVIDRDGRIGTGHRFVTVSGHPDHPF